MNRYPFTLCTHIKQTRLMHIPVRMETFIDMCIGEWTYIEEEMCRNQYWSNTRAAAPRFPKPLILTLFLICWWIATSPASSLYYLVPRCFRQCIFYTGATNSICWSIYPWDAGRVINSERPVGRPGGTAQLRCRPTLTRQLPSYLLYVHRVIETSAKYGDSLRSGQVPSS